MGRGATREEEERGGERAEGEETPVTVDPSAMGEEVVDVADVLVLQPGDSLDVLLSINAWLAVALASSRGVTPGPTSASASGLTKKMTANIALR